MLEIKILGTGCPKCRAMEKTTRQALDNTGIEAEVHKVEDIMKIMEYGVMRTPGLVINGKLVASGRSFSLKEIEKFLIQNS